MAFAEEKKCFFWRMNTEFHLIFIVKMKKVCYNEKDIKIEDCALMQGAYKK